MWYIRTLFSFSLQVKKKKKEFFTKKVYNSKITTEILKRFYSNCCSWDGNSSCPVYTLLMEIMGRSWQKFAMTSKASVHRRGTHVYSYSIGQLKSHDQILVNGAGKYTTSTVQDGQTYGNEWGLTILSQGRE